MDRLRKKMQEMGKKCDKPMKEMDDKKTMKEMGKKCDKPMKESKRPVLDRINEKADRARHYKDAAPVQKVDDNYSPGAKKMMADHKPELAADENEMVKQNVAAIKASAKEAPKRNGDNTDGDKKIVKPVSGAVTMESVNEMKKSRKDCCEDDMKYNDKAKKAMQEMGKLRKKHMKDKM